MSGSSSSILLRKRGSDVHRRRSSTLGAVKIAEDASSSGLSPSPSLASTAELETPQHSPLLDCKVRAGGNASAGRRPEPSLPGGQPSGTWETAATQVVQKSLDFMTADGAQHSPLLEQQLLQAKGGKLFKLSSDTLLDKGLDAINNVGRLMEGFALSLDNVIGQAFEEWGTPKSASKADAPAAQQRPLAAVDQNIVPRREPAPKAAAAADAWGDFPIETGPSGDGALYAAHDENLIPAHGGGAPGGGGSGGGGDPGKQARMTSFMSKLDAASDEDVQRWRKRALLLQRELKKLSAQQSEYLRLKEQCERMQAEVKSTSTEVVKLSEENSKLKRCTSPPPPGEAVADPVAAQQVMQQMEALLAEKARLAQENDRLLRENNGLQELLEFTMIHQSEVVGDDELFADDYDSDEAASYLSGPGGEQEAHAPGGLELEAQN